MLWLREFIQAQGYNIRVILEQDNKSTIKFHRNAKWGSSKCTRQMNIKYFFMKDQIDSNKMEVEHCNTDEMTSDYMSKPLVGAKFYKFKNQIMNLPCTVHNADDDTVTTVDSAGLSEGSILEQFFQFNGL